ncbi:hypothetical protein AB0I28_33985 [Phytomonospora sp. NPDC050363]|uniref:hypothetical protein n=1 Tax=Phytomonospora sp. NPDC050363 TaxID=3155642 RepID=UPI0033F4F38A
MSEEQQPKRRLELNGLQVAAATAAAVTATVVASTLGVAGTIIGAVLASVISTVGSALYLASMNHTKERLRHLPKTLRIDVTKIDGDRPTRVVETSVQATEATQVITLEEGGTTTGPATGRATVTVPAVEPVGGTGDADAPKRWKAVVLTALVVCALTFGVVTVTEALLGQPLAGLFGQADGATGTSLNNDSPPQGDDRPGEDPERPAPTDSDTDKPTPTPTTPGESPSSQSPSPSPTPSSPSPSSTTSPTPQDGVGDGEDAQGA